MYVVLTAMTGHFISWFQFDECALCVHLHTKRKEQVEIAE